MAKLIAKNPQKVKLKTSGYIGHPEGNIELIENKKTYNVSSYATATTNIPEPTGTLLITENGQKNVFDYAEVDVQVPIPVPTLQSKIVIPTTSQQSITPDSGYDGLLGVIVNATPLETRTIPPTTREQTITPQSPAIGFSEVKVEAVTAQIDPDIQPENIKQGVDILGVQGALKPTNLITKQITENGIYKASEEMPSVDGYRQVEVDVPDPVLEHGSTTPKTTAETYTPQGDGFSDFTVEATPLEAKTVTPTSQQQVVTPTAPNIGLSSVTVGAAPQSTLITKQITANGTYAAEDETPPADGYSEVIVAVPREITKLVDGTITEYVDEKVTTIAPHAFYGRTALTTCIAPNVRTIGDNAFQNTNALETVDFSNVETIGSYGFYGSFLVGGIIRFPNCQTVRDSAFRNMVYEGSNPRRGFFPKLLNIQNANAFLGSTSWVTIPCLVFKQKVTLGTYDAALFAIRNNASYSISKIYVPQRYFDWYTTATNWSAGYTAYPNVIRTIEDNVDYLVSLGYDREELLREDEVPT